MLANARVQPTTFRTSVRKNVAAKVQARAPVVVRASAAAAGEVPSPEKRNIMNLLLLGAIGLPVGGFCGSDSLMRRRRRCRKEFHLPLNIAK